MNIPDVGALDAAAARLIHAQDASAPCPPVRDLIGETDLDAAYAVQQRIIESRLASGQRVTGRKIGITSAAVRKQFGVFQPDFGVLLTGMSFDTGESIPLDGLLQPRIEAEVAFVLKHDLDDPDASVAQVARATEFVMAAIEVVDSRIAEWDIRITDTVADNASSGAYVLGGVPYSLAGLDLATVGMVIEHAGEAVSVGAGVACMGSPIVAVAWLAREAARRGAPLRAGHVILSGALGPVVPVGAPGRYQARLDGLGRVDAVFERTAA